MKKMSLQDLTYGQEHVLEGIVPGNYLHHGGLNFSKPGGRSHDVGCACDACDGKGRHVHVGDHETFLILQGKAVLEVEGTSHPLCAGDVAICEPGEDHHVVSDPHDPCVLVYLHAADTRNPGQA